MKIISDSDAACVLQMVMRRGRGPLDGTALIAGAPTD
jgi:hypothetical protein